MSGEAISAGIMIVGSVIGAAFLITAILPAVFAAGGTFGTVARSADDQMRTDFEIIRAFTPSFTPSFTDSILSVDVWIKNTGQTRFHRGEIASMDVFFGNDSELTRLIHTDGTPDTHSFSFSIEGQNSSDYWNPGDTLHIKTFRVSSLTSPYNFTLVTPNGVSKTHIFGEGI